MLIWSGYGFLAALIPLAFLIAGTAAIPESPYSELMLQGIVFLSAIVVWALGRRLNRGEDKALLDPETGEKVILRSRNRHTFFWIPMQYAGLLWMVALAWFAWQEARKLFPDGHLPQEEAAWTNSIGMEFLRLPAGAFVMGADDLDEAEKPPHKVTLTQPFYLGKFEVTQRQWEAVMGGNPSGFKGPERPVENVSWSEAKKFIDKLNEKEGLAHYRLPTEAEWEYAARAGTSSGYSFGQDVWKLGEYAWFGGNSGDETHPVGQKLPNPWGLHDMHGNVLEWVNDIGEKYSSLEQKNPTGAVTGEQRIMRGGAWNIIKPNVFQSAYRVVGSSEDKENCIGFRVALSPRK